MLAAIPTMPGLHATEVEESLKVVSATNREAATSQQQINTLSAESQALLEEYRRTQNSAEYQAAYTQELQLLKAAQETRITVLEQQIEEVSITGQRIVPLMRSMADALEKFVLLDLPFHQEQRITAVLQLQRRLRQPGLPLAAKFRLLLESWQLEQDYGVTIETWRGSLELADVPLSVEFLRIGRIALYYQSPDGQGSGYWDSLQQEWVPLAERYNQPISEALRVAKKQVAPHLLILPMASAGEAQ